MEINIKSLAPFVLAFGILSTISCSKDELDVVNPNEVTMEALKRESGMNKAALGVYGPMKSTNYGWDVMTTHNIMGDVTTAHTGNRNNWRWVNQPASITLPDGTKVLPPEGESQPKMLEILNTREQGGANPTYIEWKSMYAVIGHTNLMLSKLDEVSFEGSEEVKAIKRATYRAWFLWWRGFAYSHLGSLYAKAIVNEEFGKQQHHYSTHEEVIAEATKNFEEAKTILSGISDADATYLSVLATFMPDHFKTGKGGVLTPSVFIRNINSMMARNILVNTYANDLTQNQLSEIETLANNGIRADDKILIYRSTNTPSWRACFVAEDAWAPYKLLVGHWEEVSERLIQDFKSGDNRLTRNFKKLSSPFVWLEKGLSYGTTWQCIDGSDYTSTKPGVIELPFAASYEENQLMLAEVKIRQGNIESGLQHIDNVRNYQNAQLAAVVGTGLTQQQALEELRKERRVALFLKGTAFYDARRWGVLKPVSEGGGRTNANVVTDAAGTVQPCTIDYNYKEWFDVPAQESDFIPID